MNNYVSVQFMVVTFKMTGTLAKCPTRNVVITKIIFKWDQTK